MPVAQSPLAHPLGPETLQFEGGSVLECDGGERAGVRRPVVFMVTTDTLRDR